MASAYFAKVLNDLKLTYSLTEKCHNEKISNPRDKYICIIFVKKWHDKYINHK